MISVCIPHTLLSFQRRAPVSCVATVAGFPLTANHRFHIGDSLRRTAVTNEELVILFRSTSAEPLLPRHLRSSGLNHVNLDQARLQARPRELTHFYSNKSSFRSASASRRKQLRISNFAIAERSNTHHGVEPDWDNVGNLTVWWCYRRALADFCSATQPAGTTAGTSLSPSRELTVRNSEEFATGEYCCTGSRL